MTQGYEVVGRGKSSTIDTIGVPDVPHIKKIKRDTDMYYYRDDGMFLRDSLITGPKDSMDKMRAKGFTPLGEELTASEIKSIWKRLQAARAGNLEKLEDQRTEAGRAIDDPDMARHERNLFRKVRQQLDKAIARLKGEELTLRDFALIANATMATIQARKSNMARVLAGLSYEEMQDLMALSAPQGRREKAFGLDDDDDFGLTDSEILVKDAPDEDDEELTEMLSGLTMDELKEAVTSAKNKKAKVGRTNRAPQGDLPTVETEDGGDPPSDVSDA